MAMLLSNRKADMGIGTLIIFIAMILVAAIAAGVLIQTANSLQEQALTTGQETRGMIATHAETIEVSAINGTDGTIENFSIVLKLSPGSDSIKLVNMIYTLSSNGTTATYTYRGIFNSSWYCHDSQSGIVVNSTIGEPCASVNSTSLTGRFTVDYLQRGADFIQGNLGRGDVVRVYLKSPQPVNEDRGVRLNLIPKVGHSTLTEFITPDVMAESRIFLYP